MQARKVTDWATEITRRYLLSKPVQGKIIGLIYWQMLMEACCVTAAAITENQVYKPNNKVHSLTSVMLGSLMKTQQGENSSAGVGSLSNPVFTHQLCL